MVKNMNKKHLIILGGGSAAFAAAISANEFGARVTMINDGLPPEFCTQLTFMSIRYYFFRLLPILLIGLLTPFLFCHHLKYQ